MKFRQMTPESSVIDAYEYNYDKMELLVEFKTKVWYKYLKVDEGTFKKLQEAESKGNFIATEIKKFDFEKMEEVKASDPPPWKFPKAKDFAEDIKGKAMWPFPTGSKP